MSKVINNPCCECLHLKEGTRRCSYKFWTPEIDYISGGHKAQCIDAQSARERDPLCGPSGKHFNRRMPH